jgi:flagellum-specific ATP synthase
VSASNTFRAERSRAWRQAIDLQVGRAANLPSPPVEGSLTRMVGLALEASGCQAAVGDICDLISGDGSRCEAEVVGFSGDKLLMMPTGDVHGLAPSARVIPRQRAGSVRVGPGLLGRIIDGTGAPLDGLGPLNGDERVKLQGQTINPLQRHPIDAPLDVGVRSINSLLTVGRGQRIGLFAGSGVGKSVLLGMMARYTSADVIVVGLIGERGR